MQIESSDTILSALPDPIGRGLQTGQVSKETYLGFIKHPLIIRVPLKGKLDALSSTGYVGARDGCDGDWHDAEKERRQRGRKRACRGECDVGYGKSKKKETLEAFTPFLHVQGKS